MKLGNYKKIAILGFLCFMFGYMQAQERLFRFEHITNENGLSQNSVHAIVQDKYGFMWFGTWGGLTRYDGYSFKRFRANLNDTTALPDNRINSLFIDSLQNLWVVSGRSENLYRYNYENENFDRVPYKMISPYIKGLYRLSKTSSTRKVKEGNLRIKITKEGLDFYNRKPRFRKMFNHESDNPKSLADNGLNVIYLDTHRNLWIGTGSRGVDYLNLNSKPFAYYTYKQDNKGLVDSRVKAICKDQNGRLWIGSETKGITILEKGAESNYSYLREDKLINTHIRALLCDSYGDIWIGTKEGLDRYDSESGQIKHYYPNEAGSICDKWVFSIMEDHKGTLWFGTFNGVATYNRLTDTFTRLNLDTIIGSREVRVVTEDSRKNIWIATEDSGVTMLKYRGVEVADSFKSVRYANTFNNTNTLVSNKVFAIAEDANGMMWFGTNSGLSRLNIADNSFMNFTLRNGLPDDIIMGIVPDGENYVWVSHKKGLTRIDIHTFELRNYGVHDGLQGNEFSQNAFFRDSSSGEIYFGGVNGMSSFYSNQIKDDTYMPRVVLTGLSVLNTEVEIGTQVNDRVILSKSLLATQNINLTWWDKTISIEFAALDYTKPASIKYKYKLNGFDDQWIYTNAKVRVASYSNLPAGNYLFEVYATNSDGVWGDTPATLTIDVLPPWWLTIQFKLLVIALIVAVVILIFRIRILAYKKKRIELEELVKVRTNELNESNRILKLNNAAKDKLFTIVAHDLKNPFNAILGMSELLVSNYNDFDEESRKSMVATINNSSNNLYKLLESLLQWARTQTGNIEFKPQEFRLDELIENNIELMQTQAEAKRIKLDYCCASNFRTLADINLTNTIIRNLLNNAIKFTEKGSVKIEVNVNKQDKISTVKVIDSGVGIPEDKLLKLFDMGVSSSTQGTGGEKGTGLGLIVCKEFVEKNGGTIDVESVLGEGTSFAFTLPMA